MGPRRALRRPWRLRVLACALVVVAAFGTWGATSPQVASQRSAPPVGVVILPDGSVQTVTAADSVSRLPDSNVLADDDPRAEELAQQQASWLHSGTIPDHGFADMAQQALLDIDTLDDGGAVVAGWSPSWRYVWPRDASFAVAALSATGHSDDAYAILQYLAQMQHSDGTFDARTIPDGSGRTPDARPQQLDGSGWFLWAVASWAKADASSSSHSMKLAALLPAVSRCLDAIDANTSADGRVTVSPDYWERSENSETLGTAAPFLVGTRAIATMPTAGLPLMAALAERADALSARVAKGIDRYFAPNFPRHAGGDDIDTAVAFLMPPFIDQDDPNPGIDRDEVAAAWASAPARMARPAGGLAPGSSWKDDGVSWTPTTAIFALTAAASGDTDDALQWLQWLNTHRTSLGSLSEKVTADGQPAAAAPLMWTASIVVLALTELPAGDSPS